MAGKRSTSMGFSRVPCSGSKDLKEGEGELSVLSLSLASGGCDDRRPSRVEQTSGMNQLQTLWSIAIRKRTSSVRRCCCPDATFPTIQVDRKSVV